MEWEWQNTASTGNIGNSGYLWLFCHGAINLRKGFGGEGVVLMLVNGSYIRHII
jgi:hypothetical protein